MSLVDHSLLEIQSHVSRQQHLHLVRCILCHCDSHLYLFIFSPHHSNLHYLCLLSFIDTDSHAIRFQHSDELVHDDQYSSSLAEAASSGNGLLVCNTH